MVVNPPPLSGHGTTTDRLNAHASEFIPPFGRSLHMHLCFAKSIHWRIVTRASPVCKIKGRCYRVNISLPGNIHQEVPHG